MGVLVPEDFSLSSLANAAEQAVVDSFVEGLSDGWLVLPDVSIAGRDRDFQLDVVLIHQQFGVLDVEVKGHRVSIESGEWRSGAGPGSFLLEPQPPDQARKNAYALRDHLRDAIPHLSRLEVPYGIALPHTTAVVGHLPDLDPSQILTSQSLDDASETIEDLATWRSNNQPLTADDVVEIVSVLRPDAEVVWDASAHLARSRRRLDELCATQVQVLRELDANKRVIASGGAGTGKTRLALAWANRAFTREERVLLTCYNEPLASSLAERLPTDDSLRAGPFLRLALGLDGMPALSGPPADGAAAFNWWTTTVPAHLTVNWHLVTERFDTIVVDEAQDFAAEWIELLEDLLDPDGADRLLLVADEKQQLYTRGFELPTTDDGWTVCKLVANCRNAHQIGALLRRKLGGAPAPATAPEAVGLSFVPAAPNLEAASSATQAIIDRLVVDDERDPSQVVVLTAASRLRDHLLASLGLYRWEDRAMGIVCENVHRLKGLEADTVILVADQADVADGLLYVGISRAVSELIVIGPVALGTRLGLA